MEKKAERSSESGRQESLTDGWCEGGLLVQQEIIGMPSSLR